MLPSSFRTIYRRLLVRISEISLRNFTKLSKNLSQFLEREWAKVREAFFWVWNDGFQQRFLTFIIEHMTDAFIVSAFSTFIQTKPTIYLKILSTSTVEERQGQEKGIKMQVFYGWYCLHVSWLAWWLLGKKGVPNFTSWTRTNQQVVCLKF